MATTRFIDIKIRSKSAERNVDNLDRKMKGLGKTADSSLFKLSKIAQSVGAALVVAKIAESLFDAARAATAFNASISNLSAITGAVGKDLEFLRKTALEFGATTTLSATQAAEALKLVASAKPDLLESGEALKEVTKQAIILAEAAGVDLATAARTVGSTLNQFSADSKEAARFINVLAAGAKFGASEIDETALALQKSGVAAASASISFEEANAAIQVLGAVSIKGAEAGTALRNIFLKLNNDVDKSLRPSVVGLRQALINLNNKNLESTDILKKFGLENINAAETLLKNVDSLDQLTNKLTGTNTAIEQATVNMDNLAGDVKALGSAFETLQINIGTLADEDLRQLTQSLTTLLQAINGDQKALEEWGNIINTASVAAQTLGAVIGAKLAVSIGIATISTLAYIRAQTAATITTNALGVVTARTTVLMNTMSLATRGAATALALLGGPVGVAFLAATAIFLFVDATDDAEESSKRYKEQLEQLNDELGDNATAQKESNEALRESSIQKIKSEISDLTDRLRTQNQIAIDASRSSREMGSGFASAQLKAEVLKDRIDALRETLFLFESSVPKADILEGVFDEQPKDDQKVDQKVDQKIKPVEAESPFIARLKLETEALERELRARQLVSEGILSEEESRLALRFDNKAIQDQVRVEAELIKLGEDEDAKAAVRAAFDAQQLANAELFEQGLTEITVSESEKRIAQARTEEAARAAASNKLIGIGVNLGTALLKNQISSNAKSEKEKKRARRNGVIIDTAAGISLAFATNPFPVAVPIAATIAATGIANLATINSASGISSPPSSGAGGGGLEPVARPTPAAQDIPQQTKVIELRTDGTAFGLAVAEATKDTLESFDEGISVSIATGIEEAKRIGAI